MELTLRTVLMTAIGGSFGAAARLALTVVITNRFPHTMFPVATLLINVTGSFLLALLAWTATTRLDLSVGTRMLISMGLLGSFTTYSTFSVETFRLAERGRDDLAVVYVVLTTGLALAAAAAGMKLARLL